MKHQGLTGDNNQCSACGELFKSSAAFEKHRVGEFGIDRRCLTPYEMLAKKMAKNARGFWVTALNPLFAGQKKDKEPEAVALEI